MSDKQSTTETSSDEAIVIEAESLEHDTVEKTKTRRWPLFVLAFIVGSATSIFALNYYQQNYVLKSNNTPLAITPITKTAPESATIEPIQEVSKPIDTQTLETSTAISSEEGEALVAAISALQDNIQGLQSELQILRQQQQDVSHSQSLLESMQLHSRLSWIMKDNSHLPQIKLAWQEISLLPSLTIEQRSLAESMLKLAEQRQNNVHQWQQELNHLIISFKASEYDNIISKAITTDDANPWLQWLIKQFSLKRSQSSQEIALLTLKNTLLHIKQGMDLEQWPTGTAWTKLRAQLQLRLVKQFNTNQLENKQTESEQAKTLQLPESFDAIQADIKQLRQAAQSWLEES